MFTYRPGVAATNVRPNRTLRMLVFLLSAAVLGACANVGPPVLERAVLGYDETGAQLSQQLLLNIARWHAGESAHLTVTSCIAATFD